MDLQLYDTLTRTKRPFKPIDPSNVRMYVCGPTVYDFAHIGNARPVIVFDVLFRLLRHIYGPEHVTYVRNVTDVDDKINARAAERGISIQELTKTTYENFTADVAALGCLAPTVEPRATEHIAQMKELIERLVKNGCAYVAEDHVLFHVAAMKDYGKLSHRSLDEMIAGARVEVAPYKKDATDFVLWKPSKPGEPSWPSPAGIAAPGRPGWHLECSAMSDYWLWEKAQAGLSAEGRAHPHQFDIHGGGIDLVFPHHENEIAQSRCAFHTPAMANYWMHNGFLQVEGEKMAKSAGNFVTIHELLETTSFGSRSWFGDVVRLAMIRTHYRQPIDWTVDGLVEAEKSLQSWARVLLPMIANNLDTEENSAPEFLSKGLLLALSDDLNTAAAIAEMHRLASEIEKGSVEAARSLLAGLRFLGVRHLPMYGIMAAITELNAEQLNEVLSSVVDQKKRIKIEHLIERRTKARTIRDWAESDRIRDELAAMGVVLKDTKDGTTWELAR